MIFYRQRIRCKPISPCKLWKFQPESLDQHPRVTGDWVILQSGPALRLGNRTFVNSRSHLSASLLLDVDLMAQIEVFIVYTEKLVCNWYIPYRSPNHKWLKSRTTSRSQLTSFQPIICLSRLESTCLYKNYGNHKLNSALRINHGH